MNPETYDALRHFADSWHLLFMVLFLIAVFLWAIRPGSNKVHRDVANSIFRNDERPAPASPPANKEA